MSERISRQTAERLHTQRILQSARWLINLHYPLLAPTEPTSAHLTHLGHKTGGAFYGGKLDGIHYIFMQRKDGALTDMEETVSVVHELVHQRHAEIVGAKTFMRYDVEEEIRKKEYAGLPPHKAVLKVANGETGDDITLSETVAEGLAHFIERDTLRRELEVAMSVGRGPKERAVQRELRAVDKKTRERLLETKRSSIYVADGIEMIEKLFEMFGHDYEALFRFVFSVDFLQTNDIDYADTEYNMLVDNPLLLPRVA